MLYFYEGYLKLSGIYEIRNRLSNKSYIGSTDKFDKRWKEHSNFLRKNKHKNKHLQNSFNKYFEEIKNDDFIEFHIVEVMKNSTKEDRLLREEFWISFAKANQINIFNIWLKPTKQNTIGLKGKTHSEKTKQIISQNSKEMWENPEHQKKMEIIHSSKEFRDFQGKRIKELWENPEYKKGRIEFFNSEEITKDRSERAKNLWADSDFKNKMNQIHNSEESRLRKSISHLKDPNMIKFLTKEWLSEHFCIKKISVSEIVKITGITKYTIYRWLKRYNLSIHDLELTENSYKN